MLSIHIANIWIILTLILAIVCLIYIVLPLKYFRISHKLSGTLTILLICCSALTWIFSDNIYVAGEFSDLVLKIYTFYILVPISLFLSFKFLISYYLKHKN